MLTMWVYLLACVGTSLAQTESLVVHLEQGPVRGYKDTQEDFFSFLNIPYATAPKGSNKYKAPLPPPVWTEPLEAVNRWVICPQRLHDAIANVLTTQEDCLVANIVVPDTNATNLSVLVYVHGGVYLTGAGFYNQFTSLVITKKTIVVTFYYRLGVHGFLCLGTEDVPGNAGLKDQVALLRWVNRNIARFGGNPNDVTIAGCSAGGESLDFLSLSPMTAGLFKRVITESGAVFGVTGAQSDPIENAKLYAKQLNFTNIDNITSLEEFYKTVSFDFLFSKTEFIVENSYYGSSILFAPCVEREIGQERFLADTPANILKNGNYLKIPMLYGFSEMEGLIRIPELGMLKNKMNENFSDFLPVELKFENEVQKHEVAAKVREFYFRNEEVSDATSLAYVDYFTDILFAYPMLRAANLRRTSLDDPIYLFKYSFVDENTPMVPNTNVRGANHCDQAFAVADEDDTDASEEYKAMKETIRELWLNFITTGNPTPEGSSLPPWPAMNGFVSPFMLLNATSRVEQSSLLGDRVRFWDTIYEQFYRAPVPPTAPASEPDSASISTMSFILQLTTTLIIFVIT